jgi:hypothetical protein
MAEVDVRILFQRNSASEYHSKGPKNKDKKFTANQKLNAQNIGNTTFIFSIGTLVLNLQKR